ncbi:trehalose-phosphatase [Gilvimarinus sp. SDUM040013]|uniref:Trehalose 6-phosphate phosphatase n=1 Tax=Gilvimarinus gilvus TaxID=3058038 RepID=A0ABU4RSY0_9GAMM|nr:trehalose-phosphatase [Gilvimarinus sp. SDUM040013]MDO3388440.1 trehalose-phosphatase [Gilvimarinus sp. SDUM040013]MDX6847990.1 trehalose-phosphatase [Gilvimarinus sp. SDUM040013]
MQITCTENIGLFLDFDGTLVDFAQTPEGVYVPEELRQVLGALAVQLNGALALVSGRALDSLSGLINLPLTMAGSHGAEWRYGDGPVMHRDLESAEFVKIKAKLLEYAEDRGLIVEDKGHAIALHYRGKEHLREALDSYIDDQLSLGERTDMRVIKGNCVREIQPVGVDKGVAIAHFMSTSPFIGRQPVYIGDDTTDEDGFAWVNQNGGVSIKVGPGESCAGVRLCDTGEVLAFLQLQLKRLEDVNERAKSGVGVNR